MHHCLSRNIFGASFSCNPKQWAICKLGARVLKKLRVHVHVHVRIKLYNAGNSFRKTFYETRLHPLAADITVCEVRGRESEMIINSPRAIWRGKRWWMIDFFRLSVRAWLKRGFFSIQIYTGKRHRSVELTFFRYAMLGGAKAFVFMYNNLGKQESIVDQEERFLLAQKKSLKSVHLSWPEKTTATRGKKIFCCHQPPSVCHATNSTKNARKRRNLICPKNAGKKTERQRRNILLHKNSPLLESRIFSALRRQRQWTEIT